MAERTTSKHGFVKLRDSCDSCASAKVRCSKEKPACSRCLSRSINCEYGTSKRHGRQPTQNSIATSIEKSYDSFSQDEWLASIINSPTLDAFGDMMDGMSPLPFDFDMAEASTQAISDLSHPNAFHMGGDSGLDAFIDRNDVAESRWDGHETEQRDNTPSDPERCCLTVSLDLLRHSSIADAPIPYPRGSASTMESSPLTLETAVSLNQHMIEPISKILDCTCTPNGNALIILGLVISKVIAGCDRAASVTAHASLKGSSNSSSSGSSSSLTDLLGAPSTTFRGFMSGASGAGGAKTRAAAEAMLDDLYQVQDIVDRFSLRVQTARLQDAAGSTSGTALQNGVGGRSDNEATISGTPLPLYNTLSVQVHADLQQRLRAVSLKVVKILLCG